MSLKDAILYPFFKENSTHFYYYSIQIPRRDRPSDSVAAGAEIASGGTKVFRLPLSHPFWYDKYNPLCIQSGGGHIVDKEIGSWADLSSAAVCCGFQRTKSILWRKENSYEKVNTTLDQGPSSSSLCFKYIKLFLIFFFTWKTRVLLLPPPLSESNKKKKNFFFLRVENLFAASLLAESNRAWSKKKRNFFLPARIYIYPRFVFNVSR